MASRRRARGSRQGRLLCTAGVVIAFFSVMLTMVGLVLPHGTVTWDGMSSLGFFFLLGVAIYLIGLALLWRNQKMATLPAGG